MFGAHVQKSVHWGADYLIIFWGAGAIIIVSGAGADEKKF